MKTRLPPVFVDTSAWIDMLGGGELVPLLERAARGRAGLGTAHTSDYVILEAYSFIARNHRRADGLRFLDIATGPGFYQHPSDGDLVDRAMARARTEALGREMSLVDWTSAELMENHGIRHILTTDRAFAQLGVEVLP